MTIEDWIMFYMIPLDGRKSAIIKHIQQNNIVGDVEAGFRALENSKKIENIPYSEMSDAQKHIADSENEVLYRVIGEKI